MKLIYRFTYYFAGFFVGLLIVLFVFSGKRTQCHYGPQARVIDNLRSKKWIVDKEIKQIHDLDSIKINKMLRSATVDFSTSNTRLDNCKIYSITSHQGEKRWKLRVENCLKKATLLSIE